MSTNILAVDGPFSKFKPFIIKVAWIEWDEIKPTKNTKNVATQYQWRMKKNAWTNVFIHAFIEHCPYKTLKGCKISFQRHKVVMEPVIGNFMSAQAVCTRNSCSMKYKFALKRKPQCNAEVSILVE